MHASEARPRGPGRPRPALPILAAVLLATALGAAPSAQSSTYAYRGAASSPESLSTHAVPGDVRSLEVRLTPLAGSAGSAGLVLHHQDASNHYLFLFSTNSTALMLYRKLGGSYTLLDS